LPQAKSLISRLWRFVAIKSNYACPRAAEIPRRSFVPQAQAA
jgi:hypothetical protein